MATASGGGAAEAQAGNAGYDVTIMADTATLDGAAKQVNVPALVAGGAKTPGSLKAAVERVHAAISGSQLR